MAKYKSIVVTNGGLELVAAAHNGDTIEFTAIKTGAGIYDGTEVLAEVTALKDVKQTLGISGLTKNESVIKVNTVLSNEGVDEAYKITELGLYAKDSSGNEILYAIVTVYTGMEDYIPVYADAPTTITFELYVDANTYDKDIIFQATVIAGTYATPQDVSDAVASMTSRMGTVQSSIMQEVNAKINDINTYLKRGPRNLLKVTLSTGSTGQGVVFTVNEDKTISLSGTQTNFNMADYYIGEAYLKADTEYILSGCPEGGSSATYRLKVHNKGNTSECSVDIGDGVTFTVDTDGVYKVSTSFMLGVNYDGIVLKPMIRLATVENDTYETYYEDAMTVVNKALVHEDVVDHLYSTATDVPPSANQVKLLNEQKAFKNGFLISGGVSKNIRLPHSDTSAIIMTSVISGPNGWGLYHLAGSNVVRTLIETGNGSAFGIDTSDGLTITVTNGMKLYVTIISESKVTVS